MDEKQIEAIMEFPLISVVVPVFNEEKFIDRCLSSIVDQTYPKLQIIMIDGGSTDSSPEICDRLADTLAKEGSVSRTINVIHTENYGVSASRNTGIREAEGEYIIFIDCDDWIEPDLIEQCFLVMTKEDADLVGSRFVSRYDNAALKCESEYKEQENGARRGKELSDSSTYSSILTSKIKYRYNITDANKFLRQDILLGDVHCWGRLYRTEFIKNRLEFIEGLTIGEDMLFLMQYLKNAGKVITMDYEGYNYYRNPNGAMTKPFTLHAMDQLTCWKKAAELVEVSDLFRKNVLISIMLIAGRIAILPENDQEKYSEQVGILSDELKNYKTSGAMKLLDMGYRLKVVLFGISPKLYLRMYHRHKIG